MITRQELNELTTTGQLKKQGINANVMLDVFQDYYDMVKNKIPDANQTMQSGLNDITRGWQELRNELADKLRPEIMTVFQMFRDGTQWLKEHEEGLIATGKAVVKIAEGFLLWKTIGALVNVTSWGIGRYNAILGLTTERTIAQAAANQTLATSFQSVNIARGVNNTRNFEGEILDLFGSRTGLHEAHEAELAALAGGYQNQKYKYSRARTGTDESILGKMGGVHDRYTAQLNDLQTAREKVIKEFGGVDLTRSENYEAYEARLLTIHNEQLVQQKLYEQEIGVLAAERIRKQQTFNNLEVQNYVEYSNRQQVLKAQYLAKEEAYQAKLTAIQTDAAAARDARRAEIDATASMYEQRAAVGRAAARGGVVGSGLLSAVSYAGYAAMAVYVVGATHDFIKDTFQKNPEDKDNLLTQKNTSFWDMLTLPFTRFKNVDGKVIDTQYEIEETNSKVRNLTQDLYTLMHGAGRQATAIESLTGGVKDQFGGGYGFNDKRFLEPTGTDIYSLLKKYGLESEFVKTDDAGKVHNANYELITALRANPFIAKSLGYIADPNNPYSSGTTGTGESKGQKLLPPHDKITGQRDTNYNITIQSQIGVETMEVTTLKEGSAEAGKAMLRILQNALNDQQLNND